MTGSVFFFEESPGTAAATRVLGFHGLNVGFWFLGQTLRCCWRYLKRLGELLVRSSPATEGRGYSCIITQAVLRQCFSFLLSTIWMLMVPVSDEVTEFTAHVLSGNNWDTRLQDSSSLVHTFPGLSSYIISPQMFHKSSSGCMTMECSDEESNHPQTL